MNKKIIIPVVFGVLLVIGIVCLMLLNKKEEAATTITLDINPSIEIRLNKEEEVISITALNDDAKDIVSNDLKGLPIDEALKDLSTKIVEKGYADEGELVILVNSTGEVDSKKVEGTLYQCFDEHDRRISVISIEEITEEDKKLAEKYDITPAKAAYINSIKNEVENVDVESLKDKSINDLKETKMTGKYCDEGYTQEGDFCLKEISREAASTGEICPRDYNDYNGICYRQEWAEETGTLICENGWTLQGEKCYRKDIIEPEVEYGCEKGELAKENEILSRGVERPICVDKSNAKAPTLRCLLGPHTMIGGKCYVGPAPVLNGGCPNGDKLLGDGCYSLDPEDQWQCPDGGIYERSKGLYIELCPDTFSYSKPIVTKYYCRDDFKLNDNNKCEKEEDIDPYREKKCRDGFSLTNGENCVNYNDTAPKEQGYVCTGENERLRNDKCVSYEIIDAKEY